jgi:GT2 family glycosyltransferase
MVEALGENPRYGLAAASGPCRSKPQSDGYPGMPLGVVVADHPLANFCQVVKAQLYRDLGLHDTELIHYSDESDFSMRARAAGWLEIWVQDVWVDHRVSLPIQEWWEHDRAVFKRKWSK